MYSSKVRARVASLIRNHPVFSYFVLTFAVSWTCALSIAAPQLTRHAPVSKKTGILMFPAMLLGPSLTGVVLARVVDGTSGIPHLLSRIFRRRVPVRWYAALLIPPTLIVGLLFCLERWVSSDYAPNWFVIGIFFGVPAGLIEEIGWTGYVFPKMRSQNTALAASILLGVLWGAWHLPVVNYLGTATPHSRHWLSFFLVFTVAMTAMRVLICWMYSNTTSVLLAQFMHVSSTGSLVVFSAPRVTAAQEVMWYGIYGALLWLVVALIVARGDWRGRRRRFERGDLCAYYKGNVESLTERLKVDRDLEPGESIERFAKRDE